MWLVTTARFITNLGTLGVLWWSLALGILFANGARGMRTFWLIISGLLTEVVVNGGIIKHLVMRPRPYSTPDLYYLTFWDTGWKDTAFMSGHSMTAFACAVIIATMYPKTRLAVYPAAVLIAFSRVYLGSHFPTDVISGSIIGVVIGLVILHINKKYLPQLPKK